MRAAQSIRNSNSGRWLQSVADRLREVFTAFMRAEEARQRAEAQKRFENERRKAEEARQAAEEDSKRLEREDPLSLSSRSRSRFLSFRLRPNRSRFKWAAESGARPG